MATTLLRISADAGDSRRAVAVSISRRDKMNERKNLTSLSSYENSTCLSNS